MNRITVAIEDVESKLTALDEVARKRLDKEMTLGLSDWVAMGDLATRALVEQRITQEEAQTLHVIHTGFRKASLAERVTFLRVAHQLLGERIEEAKA